MAGIHALDKNDICPQPVQFSQCSKQPMSHPFYIPAQINIEKPGHLPAFHIHQTPLPDVEPFTPTLPLGTLHHGLITFNTSPTPTPGPYHRDRFLISTTHSHKL